MVRWILFDQARVQTHDVFVREPRYSINGKTFDAKALEGVFYTDEYKEYSRGALGERELVEGFLEASHLDCTFEEYIAMFKTSITAIEGMGDVLRSLAQRYRLATAINEGSEWARYKLEVSGFAPYFEKHVISGDIGLEKPDTAFYEKALEMLGAEASECLFTDDRAENCEAAQRLGIRSIVFTDAPQLREALRIHLSA